MAVVRPYNLNTDFDEIVEICKATAHPSIHSVVDVIPYIYAIPYVNLEPETAFVLDAGSSISDPHHGGDETDKNNSKADSGAAGPNGVEQRRAGSVVGYIIGTANTQRFVERYRTEHLISPDLPTPASSVSLDNSSSDSSTSEEEGELRNTFLRILHEPEGMLHTGHPGFLEQYPAHLHIDILPSHQAQGYGGALIARFLEELRKREVGGVHLGMRADNTLAGRFYEKHGFEEAADIKMNGTTWMVKGLKPTQVDGN